MNESAIIVLRDFPDLEAAKITVNDATVFSGNYWDFHKGCRGPIIADRDLSDVWNDANSEPNELLRALAEVFKKEVPIAVLTETYESDDSEAVEDFYNDDVTLEEFLEVESSTISIAGVFASSTKMDGPLEGWAIK